LHIIIALFEIFPKYYNLIYFKLAVLKLIEIYDIQPTKIGD